MIGFERFALLVLRIAMGGLLLFSAWQKLHPGAPASDGRAPTLPGPLTFSSAVEAFRVVHADLVPFVTFVVPWTEVVVGVCLVLGLFARSAGLLATIMLGSFTAAIVSVVLRPHISLACGCFGEYKLLCHGPIGWCKVGENLILIAALLPVAVRGGGLFAIVHDAPATRTGPAPLADAGSARA